MKDSSYNVVRTMSFLPSVTGNGLVYTTYIFMVIFLGDRLLFQAHPDTLSSRTSGGRNFPHCESQGISKCSVESFCCLFRNCLQRHQHRIIGAAEQADHVMSEFIRHSSSTERGTMMLDYQPV
jgi:hypothetical protein